MDYVRVVRKFEEPVRFDLTHEERSKRAQEARRLKGEIDVLKAMAAEQKKELVRDLDAAFDAASSGCEYRPVPMHDVLRLETASVRTIRLDTNETVRERPMTTEERQEELGLS